MAQGVQSEADYILNCNYFEYYYRLMNSKWYGEMVKESMKNTNTNSE